MIFKIYFEIKEEIKVKFESGLDKEMVNIIIGDVVDGVIDNLHSQGFDIVLKKIERKP